MKLITKEIEKRLPKLYSQENEADPIVQLKLFTPDAQWTWYIYEGEKHEDAGGDWLLFGKVVSPMCPDGEIGYVSMPELRKVRGGLGLPIERDMYFKPKPLSQCK